jgi:hypothetical protein
MKVDRIKILEEFYEENPTDPFNLYALALEYGKFNSEKANLLFDLLLNEFEDYLPTYYQAVEFFVARNQMQKAMAIAKKGIEKAIAAKELKTAGEIRTLLDLIDE